MKGKTLLIFIVSCAFFTLAATYRFHDSAHSMGMIKKGGGMARHPAVLDKDRDSYVLIATAGVMPPYRGDARVVLEGDPNLTATFHNSEVPIDLGVYRHPAFRDNTYYDLRPKDRIALWIKIKRGQSPALQHAAAAGVQQQGRGAEPPCPHCEPDEKVTAAVPDGKNVHAAVSTTPEQSSRGLRKDMVGKGDNRDAAASGSRWRGNGGGTMQTQGPAVAFYDAATNEPLLRIPIRFTDGKGGGRDEH